MSDRFSEIRLSDINLSDRRYDISDPESDLDKLALSIKTMGLLNPPVVRPARHGFTLISGFKRIQALVQNRQPVLNVQKLPDDIEDSECAQIAVALRAFATPLTQTELIRSVRLLLLFFTVDEIADTSESVLNTRLGDRFIKDLDTIGNMIPAASLDLIRTGSLSIKTAQRLADLDPDVRSEFIALFSSIKASAGKQLDILQFTRETAARQGISPETLLKDPAILEILQNTDKDEVTKANMIRQFLFDLRYPALSVTQKKTREDILALKLGNTIKIRPPENFESRKVSFSFTAQSHKDFKEAAERLFRLKDNPTLKMILDR